MCPSRDPPPCVPASRRYRTHDGTCNNRKRPRWGASQMPFHRFLAPEYADGVEGIRRSINSASLPSARFVSLVVHGSRHEESPVTMMLAMWGQLVDHDLTATAQPRSLNGSIPRCCDNSNGDPSHPSCLPIKVPLDDPWLSALGVRCLEFLRSAPAQRRDCVLSWREQTNQVTSYIDASPIYSSSPRSSDNARIFRDGMLLFGRGHPSEDVCFQSALANQCIRPGDARSGEQPGLLMLHMVWVNEHNQIARQLTEINPHWSDEKLYQETRRIVGAMFQHITFREFLPVVLGKEVCELFDLNLQTSGYYKGYDPNVNPTVANEFSSSAFRFGHSLIQASYMRADRHHRFIPNNVSLHEETAEGDIGGPGSLHRLIRGLVNQRALKRDEFITAELTNHLFQTRRFPFGLDLAAINIQRGRDHGLQPYINWRIPCGLTPIKDWNDLDRVMGSASAHRLRKAYRFVDDIDLFVGGLAERPVVGGIVGPTFACIIAQQFSNLRKGDRFWYENPGFESSFTPAQLESIRQVAFSQVLCRTLQGGTLQPHVFLPADVIQNERLSCDSKLMAPIDLDPWTERDPFTRPNDSPNAEQPENQIDLDTSQSVFSTSTTTRQPAKGVNVINKVDFVPNGNTGLQIPANGQIVLTNSPRPSTTVVNNKLDLSTPRPSPPTRPSPQKEPQMTALVTIHNKLDINGTSAPPKRRPTRKTTPKRQPTVSSNFIVDNLDFERKHDSTGNTTKRHSSTRRLTKRDVAFANLSKLFTSEDNVTLTPKGKNALRNGYYQATGPSSPSDYDDVNNYDYNVDSDPPVFVKPGYGYDSGYGTVPPPPPPQPPYYGEVTQPPLPPYCTYNCYNPPDTNDNPYQLDTRRPIRLTTPKRGLSNKIITVDHDPDGHNRQTTKRPQPQRITTVRTFIQRPGLLVINDNRPSDKPIFLSSSSPSASISQPVLNANVFPQNSKRPSPSAASQSVFSVDPRPQFSSRPSHTHQSVPSPIFSQKHTNFKSPLKELRTNWNRLPPRPIFSIGQINDYDDSVIPDPDRQTETLNIHEHDGYLRPEQNHYEPLKKTVDYETYRDYSLYNIRNPPVRIYQPALQNATLWMSLTAVRRYADRYQQPLELNDNLDQFVGTLIEHDKLRTFVQRDDQNTIFDSTHHSAPNGVVAENIDLTSTNRQTIVGISDMIDLSDLTDENSETSVDKIYTGIKLEHETKDAQTDDHIQNALKPEEIEYDKHYNDNITDFKNSFRRRPVDKSTPENVNDGIQTLSEFGDERHNRPLLEDSIVRCSGKVPNADINRHKTAYVDIMPNNDYVRHSHTHDNSQTRHDIGKGNTDTDVEMTETYELEFDDQNGTNNDENEELQNVTIKLQNAPTFEVPSEQEKHTANQTRQRPTQTTLVTTKDNFEINSAGKFYTGFATSSNIYRTNLTDLQSVIPYIKVNHDMTDKERKHDREYTAHSNQYFQLNSQTTVLNSQKNPTDNILSNDLTQLHTLLTLNNTDVLTDQSNLVNNIPSLILAEAFARTANRPDIQSILPNERTEHTNEPVVKLTRSDEDATDLDHGSSFKARPQPQRQTMTTTAFPTTNTDRRPGPQPPRKRRPGHEKRPTATTTTSNKHTNQGQHSDRRQPTIALVPFVLLTSIERPDNWVMVNVAKSKKRNPLPEVPQLKSELFSLSELPKPISAEE